MVGMGDFPYINTGSPTQISYQRKTLKEPMNIWQQLHSNQQKIFLKKINSNENHIP